MRRTILVFLASTALLGACSDATAPRPLGVTVREVTFNSDAERQAWPTTPTVEGGANIRIRGVAYVNCTGVKANAVQRDGRIEVGIREANPNSYCPQVIVPAPAYEVTITGLGPGRYSVRATVEGFQGAAEWAVEVFAVGTLD